MQSQVFYASMVRRHLSPEELAGEFIGTASTARFKEGATGVAVFSSRIDAPSEERESIFRDLPPEPTK